MDKPDDEIALPAVAAALRRYAARPEYREEIARLLAPLLTSYAFLPDYRRFFQIWEAQRVHVSPVHFYSPIPDTRDLPDALWERASDLPGIDMNEAGQLALLDAFRRFQDEYDAFPHEPTDNPHAFHYANTMFAGTDALALYCMVRHVRPARILEVGSGFSTRLSAQALAANGAGELICIEPYPDDVLRGGFPSLTSLIATPVQDVPMATFETLQSGDILFIDSSHVVKCGSDVNWLYLDVLPRLAPGVFVHLHDIFLPREYSEDWLRHKFLFWSEQYLLQAFLAFNDAFEVVFANAWLAETHLDALQAAFPRSPWWGAGGSFWMRRKPA